MFSGIVQGGLKHLAVVNTLVTLTRLDCHQNQKSYITKSLPSPCGVASVLCFRFSHVFACQTLQNLGVSGERPSEVRCRLLPDIGLLPRAGMIPG